MDTIMGDKMSIEDALMHYGVKRRSGRYPWGSGDNPYQHSGDFISRVDELKEKGWTEKQIADEFDITTTQYRTAYRVAAHERRQLQADRARSLREDGKSLNEIAEIMGFKNDSSVRSLLNEDTAVRKNQAMVTADILRKELEAKGAIDVGAGVERELGITRTTLEEAIYILELEGKNLYGVGIPQVTNPGSQTNTKVLANPDISYGQLYKDMTMIKSIDDYHSTDGGSTYHTRQYPASINSSRVKINYGDEGGAAKDGVIEIRRGVKDLSLGNSHYAQVRILVDGTHYLKGMAMYSDDLPDGVDILFNTNKKSGTPKTDVMKKIKDDPSNPFGAYIKANGQSTYIDIDGTEKLSAINKLKEEGDWDTMSKNLSSQFLSKQPVALIKKQLNLTYADRAEEFDEIMSLTNPTVRKKRLLDFADECDSATVHLKAAALPRQSTQVILPLNSMKENEIYAPNYRNGEKVALVRYPHGGTFEIPILTVNNKNKKAIDILGNVSDAVGINSKVAEILSGADFDGDQVVVIPTNDKVRISSTSRKGTAYEALDNFDPKAAYPYKEGMKVMTKANTQKQMGSVSNLITDMTLRGASEEEIVRAVKHSMVVIDAEKHKLDYKQSEKDNGIKELKEKYQGGGGASTLISKKKQDVRVPERQGSGTIDPKTGKVSYKTSGRTYVDEKTGETVLATEKVKLISTYDDAYELSSGTPQENAYADYANKMKSLANQARKEAVATPLLKQDSEAKKTYAAEVSSLNAKLNDAAKNAPRERQANIIANSVVKAKKQDNPDMDKKEIKKAKQIAIEDARVQVGASGKDTRIKITEKEWEAIQNGAISDNKLNDILRYADPDQVKEYSTPRTSTALSEAKVNKIKAMNNSGYTNAEIADALNISTSTVSNAIRN